jgi:hypothetical protein
MKLTEIIKEIESFADFNLKHLPVSTVYKNVDNNYHMINIWENRDEALKVLVDLKYNDYTLIPF